MIKFPILYRHVYDKVMGSIELDESIIELIIEKIKLEKRCKDVHIFTFSYLPDINGIVPDVNLIGVQTPQREITEDEWYKNYRRRKKNENSN